jgi:LuxR family maltose regulon positive regulatory protein
VLTSLLNDVAALPPGTLLVLDDYHLVRSGAVHDALRFVLDHLPPSVQLVISTREDPPLALSRLRGRGELVEVRAADLGFTVEEASEFFVRGMGLPLSRAQVAALVARTEGWAAGLQLAGLAMRSRTDIDAFVGAFTGSHRLVADYLAAEVLDHQPVDVQRFLLTTSVLDRMCAPLCDAVLGSTGSQRVLAELERANLFVVPLDDERTWFRYHHLFAEVLHARLAGDGDEGSVLAHRRASEWFGRAGFLPEAIKHALTAGSVEDAAALVESVTPMMLAQYAIQRAMTSWLAALPDDVVRARPMLCLAQAWLLIHVARPQEAAAWVDAAEAAIPSEVTTGRLRGATAALRAAVIGHAPGTAPSAAQAVAEAAVANLAPEDLGFRVVAGVVLGQSALAQGRPEQADEAVATVTAAARSAGVPQATLVASAHLVAIRRLRGAHRAALRTVRSALVWAEEQASTAAPAAAMLSAQLAELLLDRNELAAARSAAEQALATLRHFPHMQPPNLLSRLIMAKVLVAAGDAGAALEVVAEARAVTPSSAGVGLLISAAEASALMASGDTAGAARWAAAVELPELVSLGMQTHRLAALVEAAWVTPARILTVQGLATGDEAVLRAAAWRVAEVRRLARDLGFGALDGVALLLEAVVAAALGTSGAALEALDAAVARCVPEGIVRPFVDAGAPMAALLTTARQGVVDGSAAAEPLDVLLTACTAAPPPARPPRNGLIEALTLREHEVLRLLADGRSNAEIARTLVVEQSTVKTHLVHVYRKLEVRSRTQALARARDLRLVD